MAKTVRTRRTMQVLSKLPRVWIIRWPFSKRKILEIDLGKPLFKYLIVGGCAFVVEFGSFYGLYAGLEWPLYLANSTSFCLGLLTSFCLNRLWTFKHDTYHRKTAHQFGLYVGLALINLMLTNLFVEGFVWLGANPQVSKLAAMIITSAWNYILFKVIIFAQHKSKPTK